MGMEMSAVCRMCHAPGAGSLKSTVVVVRRCLPAGHSFTERNFSPSTTNLVTCSLMSAASASVSTAGHLKPTDGRHPAAWATDAVCNSSAPTFISPRVALACCLYEIAVCFVCVCVCVCARARARVRTFIVLQATLVTFSTVTYTFRPRAKPDI